MRKTFGKIGKFTREAIAFFVIALVFLAVGLGTLGSAETTGDAYELKAKRASGDASVVLRLTSSVSETETDDSGSEKTVSYTLHVKAAYANVGVVYAEAGEPGVLRMDYGSSESHFDSSSRRVEATIENFGSAEGAEEETEPSRYSNALFNWIKLYDSEAAGSAWSTSYSFVRLMATDRDLLVNEFVVVAEKFSGSESTGELCVMPAEVWSATPVTTESAEEAKVRAGALIDAQTIPSEVQSTYYRYGQDELYTLSTLAEMRRGGEYDASVSAQSYHIDGVYGGLGMSVIALGTAIFGTSPFGLRFFPMLASFGVLVLGYFLVKQISKNEKAALAFAVLYALCNLSFALGHLGNPLMIGVFFFVAALYCCHRFYARGMRKASFAGALPPVLAGLFSAASICVNGAYVIPVAGIFVLFVLGMIRQQNAKRYHLSLAAEETPAPSGEETAEESSEERVARVAAEYRFKNIVAPVGFGLAFLFGAILLALLFTLPLYSPYVRLYANGSSATLFALAWHAFAGGFTGSDPGVAHGAWDVFHTVFEGAGERYAVTAVVVNAVAAAIALAAVVYALVRLILILARRSFGREERAELRRLGVPLAGLVLCLVSSAFGGGAQAFLFLAYLFAFALAGQASVVPFFAEGSKAAKAAKISGYVLLGLLVSVFVLYSVFTFSVPLSASLMANIFA